MNKPLAPHSFPKAEVSRYMFVIFDVLGFSQWMKSAGLSAVLDAYHLLIEKVVSPTSENGALSAVQTSEGALFTVTGPPGYAYFSDTILLWHPLAPPFVDDFISKCGDLVCDALSMNIPLRGAITLGDAVLSKYVDFYLGEPIIEAAKKRCQAFKFSCMQI